MIGAYKGKDRGWRQELVVEIDLIPIDRVEEEEEENEQEVESSMSVNLPW